MIAAMTATYGVGQIVGPLVAGALYERSGSFNLSLCAAAGALVVAAALVVAGGGAGQRSEAEIRSWRIFSRAGEA